LPLRRCPCCPGPYSRRFTGLFGRPQIFWPRRRSSLYLASARLVTLTLVLSSVAFGARERQDENRPKRCAWGVISIRVSRRPGAAGALRTRPPLPLIRPTGVCFKRHGCSPGANGPRQAGWELKESASRVKVFSNRAPFKTAEVTARERENLRRKGRSCRSRRAGAAEAFPAYTSCAGCARSDRD